MLNKLVVNILITTLFIRESMNRCTHGHVRLTGTPLNSQGRVEVCTGSNWGTVCRDGWGNKDAAVVCNQLNYGRDGALAVWEVHSNSESVHSVLIDEVSCNSREVRLLDCTHDEKDDDWFYCRYGGGAGVRCREELLRVKNVSIATIDTSYYSKRTVLISWKLYDGAPHNPSSFSVACFNDQHYTRLSVNNGNRSQISVGDLLSSTSYTCCLLAIYYEHYEKEGRCISIEMLADSFTIPTSTVMSKANSSVIPAANKVVSSDLNMRASKIIGGVLGCVVCILLLLLAIYGGALLYLLQSRTSCVVPKRSSQPNGANTTDMYIDRNISYVAAPSHSTTSGSHAIRAAGDESGAAAEYSRIGPSYATTVNSRRQQPVARRNQVSARLSDSERYEFSEAYLAAAGGVHGGARQGEAAVDYEVPLNSSQSREHEEYSHLQY